MARVAALVGLLLLVAATAPNPPVTVTTRTYISNEPASFPVHVRVEPHPENRAVCFTYESDGQSSRSCWQIDGDSPPTTTRWLKDVPAGEYAAWADLFRMNRSIRSAVIRFQVISSR